ncbi:MAG: 2-amino-4-hydroxy-6-hydroxymethyldihydropteridine diphosphokinase [Treponema sp.]|nr:2-amino-4-hydroxy-6-hydroxymethyldihydropteridine diphosphokinase [Treponema sp.]
MIQKSPTRVYSNEGPEPLVVLGLGSNLGDSKSTIIRALVELQIHLRGLGSSSLYLTQPLHVSDQNPFLNAAAAGYYPGGPGEESARELLSLIQGIEARHGRERTRERPKGERTLDIDILLFGDLVLATADLTIPHALLCERRFALEPLVELLPEAREPQGQRTYREICRGLPDQGVKLMEPIPLRINI